MSDSGLKPSLDRLGLKQSELARLLDVSPRTVSQWATGSQPLPGAVAGYLRLLDAASAEVRRQEFDRLEDRGKQLDEGVYRITYHGRTRGDDETDQALAVLRNGKILGSDRHGGIFMGSYRYDRTRNLNSVHLRIEVPPDSMLVNGYATGPEGGQVEVMCHVARAAPLSHATVKVAGQPVDFEFNYLGPLPN